MKIHKRTANTREERNVLQIKKVASVSRGCCGAENDRDTFVASVCDSCIIGLCYRLTLCFYSTRLLLYSTLHIFSLNGKGMALPCLL